ncbi:hypothetical protein IKG24_00895, partial [Candidatus Saccharibacteria bacterium]|nr:hypothetical protein [Candidatus Saccharibacteria bacterium]
MSSGFSSYIRNFRNLRIAGTLSSLSLIVLTLLAIFPIVHKAMEAEAASPLESNTEIEMSIGKGSANLSLIPKDTSGTFASSSSSELAEFNVTTNNYTGYTLGIKATDDTKQLTNVDMPTAKLDSITSVIDSSTFNTQAYNGKWGYKPSKYNSADNASFRPAPTTSSSTLDVTKSANSTSSNTYTIGLGARADYNTPAGNYTKTFILTAVGNPVPYTIKYLDNTGDTTVTGLPPTDSGATHNTSLPLSTAT